MFFKTMFSCIPKDDSISKHDNSLSSKMFRNMRVLSKGMYGHQVNLISIICKSIDVVVKYPIANISK